MWGRRNLRNHFRPSNSQVHSHRLTEGGDSLYGLPVQLTCHTTSCVLSASHSAPSSPELGQRQGRRTSHEYGVTAKCSPPSFPIALGAHGSDGTSLIPAPGLISDSSTATWAVERDGHVARSSPMRASPRTSGEMDCLSVGYTEQAEGKPGENEASSSRKAAPTLSGHPDPER